MKNQISLLLISAFAYTAMLSFTSCNGQNNDQPFHAPKGFAEYMYYMQIYSHKLLLSIDAENTELADFYLHELEETTEDVIEFIKDYDRFPISQLTEAMLLPLIEDLEDELETGNWEEIRNKARIMIEACNACHLATDHGYIVIPDRVTVNPFLQTF